jgi:cephalosporin-C deacetylase-like acetyl esterase
LRITGRLTTVLALCALWHGAAGAQAVLTDAQRLARYDYDAKLPLNPELTPAPKVPNESDSQKQLRTRWHLVYSSTNDQRVTAIFTLPKKYKPPYPAVILLAGSGGNKDTDYIRIASDMMNTLGYTTLSMDAQYHGERSRPGVSGDIHLINQNLMRDAWIQTVVDLRRAVDYLQSRKDIDGRKIGYLGFSQGGMIGGTFLGVEPRIAAACLVVAGGGFVEWGKKIGLWKEADAAQLEANAAVTDPIYFIGRFAPHPLLMISAKQDELIPRFATEALYNAAREPKTIHWYDTSHTLGGQSQALAMAQALLVDVRGFLVSHLGARKESRE